MIKKFSFGKVDGYGIGRKNCEVVLSFGFQEFSGQEPYFSVCGTLWNNLHTDCIRGGQCVDDLANEFSELRHNDKYREMQGLWTAYHLKPISQIPASAVERINEILKGE